MESDKKILKTITGRKEYTCLGCPLTRNRSNWCFRLCTPDDQGRGRCGRIAPHSLRSNIQLSIERFNKRQLADHCEKLERFFLGSTTEKVISYSSIPIFAIPPAFCLK